MSGRTTLKTYFLSGSTPTEANFADLIDSVMVISEDLTDSLTSDSSTLGLSASAGKTLNTSITSLDTRVSTLEGADNAFSSNYYTKNQVDTKLSDINQIFGGLTYATDISALGVNISDLEAQIAGLASSSHTHPISQVTSLQSTLDTKATIAYVDSVASGLATSIAAITISDESGDVASLQASISSINATIATLPTQSDLDNKVAGDHTHTISEITDLTANYYSKSEVDATIGTHTHLEADISDLDKYTQNQTDLIVTDHANLLTNPHNVTKAQVGLGNVENKSVEQIFASASSVLARKDELNALDAVVSAHVADANPHAITKTTVGLNNVPNINFQDLLDAHIASPNPHNFDFSSFNLFTKAETNTRIQFYLDEARYAYSPTSTDSHGAIGDIAYDADKLYVKTDSTVWKSLPWVASYTALTDVPATFAPSTHGHTWSEITDPPTLGATNINGLTDVQTAGGVAITANTGFPIESLGFTTYTGGGAYGDFEGSYQTTVTPSNPSPYQAYAHQGAFRLVNVQAGTADIVAYDKDDILNTLNDGWSITDIVKVDGKVSTFNLAFSGSMSHTPSTGQVLAWNQAHDHWMPMTLDVLGTRTITVDFDDLTTAKDKYIPIPNDGIITKVQGVLSDALTATVDGFLEFTIYSSTGSSIGTLSFASGSPAGTVQTANLSSNVVEGDSFIKVNCDGHADSHVDCVIVICVDE